MSATEKLLDKYAETCYPRKDIDLAKQLKVKKQTVSGWRNGKAHPDAESVERMAKAIGEPVGPWLAQIEAERARTPAGKQVWLRLAATLGTTLALALITLPSHAETSTRATADHCLLCQIIRRRVASLWDAAQSALRGHSRFGRYRACTAAPALA